MNLAVIRGHTAKDKALEGFLLIFGSFGPEQGNRVGKSMFGAAHQAINQSNAPRSIQLFKSADDMKGFASIMDTVKCKHCVLPSNAKAALFLVFVMLYL